MLEMLADYLQLAVARHRRTLEEEDRLRALMSRFRQGARRRRWTRLPARLPAKLAANRGTFGALILDAGVAGFGIEVRAPIAPGALVELRAWERGVLYRFVCFVAWHDARSGRAGLTLVQRPRFGRLPRIAARAEWSHAC